MTWPILLYVAVLLTALAFFCFRFLKQGPKAAPDLPLVSVQAAERRSLALLLLVYALLIVGIAASGYLSYTTYEREFRAQVDHQLSAITDLKMVGLADWRAERLGDAEMLRRSSAFAALAQAYLAGPVDSQSEAMLRAWLDSLRQGYSYEWVALLDAGGAVRMASPVISAPAPAHLAPDAAAVLASGQVGFLDFHRDPAGGGIYLTLLAPVYAGGGAGQPLGVVALRVDPHDTLYPYLQQWPTPSQTAETLLVRREDGHALYLNALRFDPDAALSLRVPLTDTESLAVKAVMGQIGTVEGRDYRGRKVIGHLRAVPDSPWFLVTRMEAAEVYAPLRERLWTTILFFGVLAALAGVGLVLLWRQQRMRYYRGQVQTLDALHASDEKFRLAFETSPDAITITRLADGRFVSVNKGFEQISGYTRAEVIGRTSLGFNLWKDLQDREWVTGTLQSGGEVRNYEAPFLTRDGEIYGLLSSAMIRLNGEPHALTIIRDITERKRAEQAIAASLAREQFLGNLVRDAYVPIGVGYPDGRLGMCNPAFQALTGYSAEELKTVLWNEVLTPPEWLEIELRALAELHRTGKPVVYEKEYLHKSGRRIPIELVVHPLFDEQDKVTHYYAFIRDITEHKQIEKALADYNTRLEAEVAQRTRDLLAAQDRLLHQERLATLGQIAGSVAHELRNPLGVISNAVYFLNLIQPGAEPRVREYLGIIHDETRAVEKIIVHLLDQARTHEPGREAVAAADVVQRSLAHYPLPENVRLVLEIPANLPPLYVDPAMIVQVLSSLIINAWQAMPAGGELLIRGELASRGGSQTRPEGFQTRPEASQTYVAISVHDTGVGIPPENMRKLFEPLFSTKTKGIGLGLSVSKKLIEANGGQITAESEVGVGSVFTLYLPASGASPLGRDAGPLAGLGGADEQ